MNNCPFFEVIHPWFFMPEIEIPCSDYPKWINQEKEDLHNFFYWPMFIQ